MSQSAVRFLQQENINLKKEVETQAAEITLLHNYLDVVNELFWTTQTITADNDLMSTLKELLYKVMAVIGAGDASLSHLDGDELVFVLAHGDLSQQLPGFHIASNMGIAGWVVENHKPIIVNDPRQDWRFSNVVDAEFGFTTQSIMSVPIMRRDKFMGVIQLLNKRGSQFNESDSALLLLFGLVAAIVLKELYARIETGQAAQEDLYHHVAV